MADFSEIVINTTAEKIERMANMEINNEVIDDTSDDNSLPTSKLVYDFVSNSASGGSGDYVSYSKAQNLTDEQKTTARKNIDALYVDDVDNVIHDALNKAIENGEIQGIKGKDGISATHSWNGTVLTITSASGTSSSDLKGEKGDTGATGSTGPRGEKGDKGDKGDTGATGTQGEQGLQGEKGDKGEKGDTGAAGQNGVSVTKTEINNKGELIITLSDNTVSNLGVVVGAKGDKGDKGEDGADYILTDDDKNEIATKANAVSYSVTQNLTDEQKQTARANIDAVSQTELEAELDEKVDTSLVVDNLVSSDNTFLIDRIPNGDAVAAFVREHGVSSSQVQSLSKPKKARARQNIDVDGGKWELLYTIEGDGKTKVWEYNQFADGSPLKLTAVSAVVIQDVAEAENSYGFLNAYCDEKSTQFPAAIYSYFTKNSAPTTSGTQRAYGVVEQYKGQYRAYSVGMAAKNNEVMRYTPFMQAKHTTADYPYIDRIKVQKQTGVFSADNKIEIYGVRYYG